MALRALARQLRPVLPSGVRFIESAPTVFDRMVQFYVIDKSGARHTVRGIEGTTLAATLREAGAPRAATRVPSPAGIPCPPRAGSCKRTESP